MREWKRWQGGEAGRWVISEAEMTVLSLSWLIGKNGPNNCLSSCCEISKTLSLKALARDHTLPSLISCPSFIPIPPSPKGPAPSLCLSIWPHLETSASPVQGLRSGSEGRAGWAGAEVGAADGGAGGASSSPPPPRRPHSIQMCPSSPHVPSLLAALSTHLLSLSTARCGPSRPRRGLCSASSSSSFRGCPTMDSPVLFLNA